MANLVMDGVTLASKSGSDVTIQNTNVKFPAGFMCGFTETTTTPTVSQGLDTSYTTLTGSSVDYTPVSGSSFVVYEYHFVMSCKDNNPIILYQPHYDGSAIANLGGGFQYTWGDGNSGNGWETITFTLPSWSGSKNLHIKYRVWDTSSEARIHNGMYGADGLIKIYRRTYSIM